ncbi:MAG: phosphoenolpyruvate hydrolase family protein [Pirellulales bacterium]|nr:phosphoenolpyruvate hydrolase family protein [Pirellulales bacterium]
MSKHPSASTRFQALLARRAGPSIVAVAAGSGQMAQYAVGAGADLLLVLNASRYRNLGAGSLAAFLPYGNANDQTYDLLTEQVLPRATDVPVVAGVLAGDVTRDLTQWLENLKHLGVSGITNWPAIGFVDGQFREALEEQTGWTIDSEIELLRQAQTIGLAAFGFALTGADARRFVEAGVEGLILDLGLTRKIGDVQQRRDLLQTAISHLNQMLDEALGSATQRPLTLAFGGPMTTSDDLRQVLRQSAIDGFAGGSVFERLPIESTVDSLVRRFKSVAIHRADAIDPSGQGEMIGSSSAMQEMFDLVRRFAAHDVNVYLEGESGTGKELVANQLHRASHRSSRPFVTLNCGAIPEGLLESELFGHEKGAFTGADRRRLGKFELAHGGTLFLDEIADLPPHGQVALLRALQQREISRVGSESTIPVDVRIVAASNRPLAQLVEDGRFRTDLYYRLNHCAIRLPPLRDRLDDLPMLVDAILSRLQVQLNKHLLGLSKGFYQRLRHHAWPGNVRELEHTLTQAALREDQETLEGVYFVPTERGKFAAHRSKVKSHATAIQALQDANGNKSIAAKALGISRKTLYAWLNQD